MLINVFTIVIEAFRLSALPASFVVDVWTAVEMVTPALAMLVPTMLH